MNGKEGLSRNIKLGPSAVVKIDDLCTCKSAGGLNLEITSVGALINVLGELIAQDQGKVDLLSDKTLSIKNIEEMKAGNKSFVLHLDDPRGESFIQPLTSSNTDLMLKMEIYDPSMSSDFNMDAHILQVLEAQKQADSSDDPKVYALGGDCPVCGHNDCCSRACVTSIPHFDEVCIWSTTCDKCGYKNTNVTPISIPKSRGARITLKITDPQDFDRYILQSVTTKIIIEELGLEASLTSNAGQFTTIEGALKGLYELYASSASVSLQHESSASGAEPEDVVKAKEFLEKFQKVILCVAPLTRLSDYFLFSTGR